MNKPLLTLSIVTLLTLSTAAIATCTKSYVCDVNGANCRYQDVCDSAIDLPSTNIQPLPTLPATALPPPPSYQLAPFGTTNCNTKQVNGRFQTVCK